MRSSPWFRGFVQVAIAFLGTLAVAAPLAAQADLGLDAGDRVRVTLRESGSDSGERQTLFGEVLGEAEGALRLRLQPGDSEVTIQLQSIERLDRSLGSSRLDNALEAGATFAAYSGIYFPIEDYDGGQFSSVGQAAVTGAAIGLVGGAILGALLPQERWRRVPVPGETSSRSGGPAFMPISLAAGFVPMTIGNDSGDGSHAELGFGVAQVTETIALRGEFMYDSGSTSAPLAECMWWATSNCLSRRSEVRRLGAGLTAVGRAFGVGERVTFQFTGGLGYSATRINTEELLNPLAADCRSSAPPAECSKAPAGEFFSTTRSIRGLSANAGMRITAKIAEVETFVQARVHVLGLREPDSAAFSPFSIGVQF